MIATLRRAATALVGAALALAIPGAASAECLGCDPPPTSPGDALAAMALFAVIVGIGVVVAVAEARGRR